MARGNRRRSNGEQVRDVAGFAMRLKPSVDFAATSSAILSNRLMVASVRACSKASSKAGFKTYSTNSAGMKMIHSICCGVYLTA